MDTNTQSTMDMPEQSNKKMILVIGGLVFLIILVILSIVLIGSKKTATSTSSTSSTTSTTSVATGSGNKGNTPGTATTPTAKKLASNNEMAAAVLGWLYTQKDGNGKYSFGQNCSSNTSCLPPIQDNRAGIQALWGRFQYYLKNKDAKDLDIVKKDIALYNNTQYVPTIQNSTWNCKLMYDLWQSSAFNQTDKQNIHDICFGSQYTPFEDSDISSSLDALTTQAEKDVEKAQRGSLSVPNGQVDQSSQKELFLNYSTAASDNIVRYNWDKQDYDIKSAYVYLSKALRMYDQHSKDIEPISPLLGVALLDLYQNSKKDSYLALAKKIYSAHSNTPCSALDSCIDSLYLAESLSKATGDSSYKQEFQAIREYLINNYFDYPGYKGLKFNKGAFYSPGVNAIYPVADNGLVIELLLQ